MPHVFLGIGSNIDRETNIRKGIQALSEILDDIEFSPMFESEALGFSGDNFYNFVISAETHYSLPDLAVFLRDIETSLGRTENCEKNSSRFLDIDILTYDELVGEFDAIQLPRQEILTSAFVLQPLAILAPNALHPIENKVYSEISAETDFADQKLWQIDFNFNMKFS